MAANITVNRWRIIASIAATLVALACGTNYVYSAWAPQFAQRLKFSVTQSNLIGLFGNLGMYTLGIPVGMFVDHKGPRPAILAGAVLLGVGYFPFHIAYDRGSAHVSLLCFFSYLTGLGGCMACSAVVKISALNWPNHRGTATAFPLAAFGLSAFFFSSLGSLLFPGNPSDFLLLLAVGTSSMTFIGFFFAKIIPNPSSSPSSSDAAYASLNSVDPESHPHGDDDEPLQHLHPRELRPLPEPGTPRRTSAAINSHSSSQISSPGYPSHSIDLDDDQARLSVDASHTDCLIPTSDMLESGQSHVDIRGLNLIKDPTFWLFFTIMSILAGVGIMTINNIGNDSKALWERYDPTVTQHFLVAAQQMHVSVLSVCSFVGRLSSGVGSDWLAKSYGASRVWCLVIATVIFLAAQLCALSIENPRLLLSVSTLSGLGYGFLFGVFPSIVAEQFGIHGMSQNWGFLTMAPTITSNVFNLFYGHIYDQQVTVKDDGERVCMHGLGCYKDAYWLTLAACAVGLGVCLWVIHYTKLQRSRIFAKEGGQL
ncbi:unnamed protein product [Clonostachys rosea f. rosea IK726]|uniref:Nodulin-like domain-containing protein n=2 Tax=Bionectria ochroleuca TaxID=29856 RepID=A0A0B7JV85_BIOOC|nr:unnamed protein product [Clonostachys rosea f. rosea IK726]